MSTEGSSSLWPRLLGSVSALLGGVVLAPLAHVLIAGSPAAAMNALREGGMLALGVGLLVSLVLAVLVPFAATRELPVAVLVGLTLLPWFTGCVTALVAAMGLAGATNLEPSMRAMTIAAGVSGYLQGHLTGALTSGAIGAGVLGGLGWTTFAVKGERDLRVGAGVGILLSGVLMVLAALSSGVAVALGLSMGLVVFTSIALLAALGPVLISSLGASTAVRRPQELGVAAALFATLLVVCAAAVNSGASTNAGMLAVAMVPADARAEVARAVADESSRAFLLGVGAAVLAALVPAAAALRAHRSGTLTRASYVGGAVASTMLIAMLAFHVATSLVARTVVPAVDGFPIELLVAP